MGDDILGNNLPGPTRRVPKHIEDELILGAELDIAKARIAELEDVLRTEGDKAGTQILKDGQYITELEER